MSLGVGCWFEGSSTLFLVNLVQMDAIRQEVLEGLQQVAIEDLLVLCAAFSITVADAKKTNKKSCRKCPDQISDIRTSGG